MGSERNGTKTGREIKQRGEITDENIRANRRRENEYGTEYEQNEYGTEE